MRPPVVVLTTATGTLAGLADLLRGEGCQVREAPLLDFAPPPDWSKLDAAILRLPQYRAVAVTSPRAAQAFAERAAALRVTAPLGLDAWATGSASAAPLRDIFGEVHLPSSLSTLDAGAASLLAGAMVASRVGSPVLFPCGDTRRDELPAALRASGITVEEVHCYRSVLARQDVARQATAGADILLVASPKVAQLVARVTPRDERSALVAVGPTTAAAARAAGWAPAGVANRPSVEAVAARIRALAKPR
ncbi:MAG TPA: uroporphyrinogen-III synthase [Gemmatimonadales bacterium]|nr:uroporphyrinogen-III synthase [Gemmatimonadales bacterium]